MSRYRSDTPSPEFHMRMIASEEDVDALGHISNIAYVRWIQDVAVAHSTAVGFDTQQYLQRGSVFVVRKHEVNYLRSAHAGDEIELITFVASFSGAQSERHTRIIRASDGQELVKAITVWAYVSTQNGRPRRIPEELQKAFYLSVGK